jgi:hypothetical protein
MLPRLMHRSQKSAKLFLVLERWWCFMNRRSVSATLAQAAAGREQQHQLRRDLAARLERLDRQIESLFTRSVGFRYSAIRQRRRAAMAALLLPLPPSAESRPDPSSTSEPSR